MLLYANVPLTHIPFLRSRLNRCKLGSVSPLDQQRRERSTSIFFPRLVTNLFSRVIFDHRVNRYRPSLPRCHSYRPPAESLASGKRDRAGSPRATSCRTHRGFRLELHVPVTLLPSFSLVRALYPFYILAIRIAIALSSFLSMPYEGRAEGIARQRPQREQRITVQAGIIVQR